MTTHSLFEPNGLSTMLARIDALHEGSVRQWGKLSVGQMCWHCQQPLRVALGELPLRRGLMARLAASTMKVRAQ